MSDDTLNIVATRQDFNGVFKPILDGFTGRAIELYPITCEILRKHGEKNKLLNKISFWVFVDAVFNGADSARAWRRAKEADTLDPSEILRRQDVEFLEATSTQASALRKVGNFINRYPQLTAFPLAEALLRIKSEDGAVPLHTATSGPKQVVEGDIVDGVNPFGFGSKSAPEVFARILHHFANALEVTRPAKAGPYLHRNQFGPFLYQDPIDSWSARPDPLINGLLFGTVLRARQFTASNSISLQRGMVMPKAGKPLWAVAAALVSDTFQISMSSHDAKNRLTMFLMRNENVGWMGWPNPPSTFMDPYT